MQKAINNYESLSRRVCCANKSSKGKEKKSKKKLIDNQKSINRSTSRRKGQTNSKQEETIKIKDFKEGVSKLNINSKTYEKLHCIADTKNLYNMHTYRLSVTRDICNEKSKDPVASMRSSGLFSPGKKREKTVLVKARNLEDEKNCRAQELDMLKKSDQSLIKMNELLSQQLVHAQRNFEQETDKSAMKERKHQEELLRIRTELHQQRSKFAELNSKLAVCTGQKQASVRQIETLQQQLQKNRSHTNELEIAICDIKKKLIHEEAGRSLKVKDAEVSSTKITEDLTGKYLKEISSIQINHREALKKIEQIHAHELESMKNSWKAELVSKQKESCLAKMQITAENQKLTLKLSQLNSGVNEKQVLFKGTERKLVELNGDIDNLKRNIEQLNKEKIEGILKLENKDEVINQIRKSFDLLRNKLHKTEKEKDEFYEAVVESSSKIEQLQKKIQEMIEQENEFMSRFEGVAIKINHLQTHIKMDKSIRVEMENRVEQLEESNRVMQELLSSDNLSSQRDRQGMSKEVDELRFKASEYKIRLEGSQEKLRKLEKEIQQLTASHAAEVFSLQNKIIYTSHAKKLDISIETANQNIYSSAKSSLKHTSNRNSVVDILRTHDSNHADFKWHID